MSSVTWGGLLAVVVTGAVGFGFSVALAFVNRQLERSGKREGSPYRRRVVDGRGWATITVVVLAAVGIGFWLGTVAWIAGGVAAIACAVVVVWRGWREMPLLTREAREWLESRLSDTNRWGGLRYRKLAMDITERTYTDQGLTQVDDKDAEAPLAGAQDEVLSPRKLLSQGFHVLISGKAGVGKSTNLRQFGSDRVLSFWAEATRKSAPYNAPIPGLVPVLLSARDLAGKTTLEDALGRAPKGMLSRSPARNAKWLILVDAVDEVFNAYQRQQVWMLLLVAIRSGGPRRFVITSRSVESALRLDLGFHRVRHYELQPFTDDQLVGFVTRHQSPLHVANDPKRESMSARVAGFMTQLRRRGLIEVVRLPLLAKLAADMYFDHHGGDLPMRRVDLYEGSIDLWLEKFDEVLEHQVLHDVPERDRDEVRKLLQRVDDRYTTTAATGVRVEVLQRFLTDLAKAYNSDGETETGRNLVDFAAELLGAESTARFPSTRRAIGRILEATGLVQDPYHDARFWHQTFAEYLAASTAVDAIVGSGPDFWGPAIDDPATSPMMIFTFHHLPGDRKNQVITKLTESPEHLRHAAIIAAEDICTEDQANSIMDKWWKTKPETVVRANGAYSGDAKWWDVVGLLAGHSTLNRRLSALCDDATTPPPDRVKLAEVLARHGDNDRWTQLEEWAKNCSYPSGIREDAIAALVRIDTERAVAFVVKFVQDSSRNDVERLTAVNVLVRIDPNRARAALEKLLNYEYLRSTIRDRIRAALNGI